MKQILIGAVAVLLLLASCATPAPEQTEPKVVDFPAGYGYITESREEPVVSAEVSPKQQDDLVKPEEISETEVVQDQPDKPDAAVVQPPAPEMPVVSEETIGEPAGEIAVSEEPDARKEQLPASDKEKTEQDEKPKEHSAVAEKEEPAQKDSTTRIVEEEPPAPPAPQEAETETAAAFPEAEDDPVVAADREADEQSTLFRAAWIGLPILLIMLVILIVEMVRWFVYKKPLFGWSGEGTVYQPYEEKIAEGVHEQKKEKKGISARISTYLDNLYKDLEEDDDEEEDKES